MRGVRLEQEIMEPEVELQASNIHSAIILFGSTLATNSVQNPDGPLANYYGKPQKFTGLASAESQSDKLRNYVVVTGGGSGNMEAANRGANDAHAKSIGLNITLPHEQHRNAYVTTKLCFQFHYFATRKMQFLKCACAMVTFPGGFGT